MNVEQLKDAIQETLLLSLPQAHPHSDLNSFYKLLRTYPERRGKQLRGLFVLLATEAQGGTWQDALKVAAALELFQAWVLVHDDIEDDSEERRGEPALHKQVGMPIALNVGDAMHVYMWQLLQGLDLAQKDAILQIFFTMIQRTAEGQHLDLLWVEQERFNISEADYLEMVTLKTAFYTVIAPLQLGALCANREPDERVVEAGKALGSAFQIRDDVLNLMQDDVKGYGKEFAGDLYEAKRTLILARAFEQLSTSKKLELETLLRKKRQYKTQDDIKRMLELINTTDALEYAQIVAEQKADKGLALIDKLASDSLNKAAASELTRLLKTLAERRK